MRESQIREEDPPAELPIEAEGPSRCQQKLGYCILFAANVVTYCESG